MNTMVTLANVGWGKYREWSGPILLGKEKYQLPPNPTKAEKFLAVVTATEGGAYDAVNMYDKCIVSVGLIQWCEAGMFGVSNMLGLLLPTHRDLLDPLIEAMSGSGVTDFSRHDGKGRFVVSSGVRVTSGVLQRRIWCMHAGREGTWTDSTKAYAKNVAVAVSNLASKEVVKHHQLEYTLARLHGFVTVRARKILFDDSSPLVPEWREMLQAAYISYAVNNPTWAQASLLAAVETLPTPWSMASVVHILKCLTFHPQVAIYPHRYNAIRPVLERLYGVDLPDFADELHEFHKVFPQEPEAPGFYTAAEIQEELVACGYDLGPKGADGRIGPKTIAAIKKFQKAKGLLVDGKVGPKTRAALVVSFRGRLG